MPIVNFLIKLIMKRPFEFAMLLVDIALKFRKKEK
jgi:hypothetical protein